MFVEMIYKSTIIVLNLVGHCKDVQWDCH